ncbi:hypothetical protein KM908_17530, partial [Alkalihalobacillus clausii]|nr:hypothetical protein [Shouchella clausii]
RFGEVLLFSTLKTVGRHGLRIMKFIQEYIKNQIQDDIVAEQLSLLEYVDPFTGEEVKRKKKRMR